MTRTFNNDRREWHGYLDSCIEKGLCHRDVASFARAIVGGIEWELGQDIPTPVTEMLDVDRIGLTWTYDDRVISFDVTTRISLEDEPEWFFRDRVTGEIDGGSILHSRGKMVTRIKEVLFPEKNDGQE